jgi:hypothetical protein
MRVGARLHEQRAHAELLAGLPDGGQGHGAKPLIAVLLANEEIVDKSAQEGGYQLDEHRDVVWSSGSDRQRHTCARFLLRFFDSLTYPMRGAGPTPPFSEYASAMMPLFGSTL